MFDKNHFNQLTSSIEKDDYIRLTIVTPATIQIKKQINDMSQEEKLEAMKIYNVHYLSALEARMVAKVVTMRFRLYKVEWC